MTTYDFDNITAGRNDGAKPWRDPAEPEYLYHIRERNVVDFVSPRGYEAVKINILTGDQEILQFWDEDTDYDDLGACFVDAGNLNFNASNIAGSISGTQFCAAFHSGNAGAQESVIITFDKTDMSITGSFATDFFLDTNGDRRAKSGGVSVMSADGTYFARGGSNDLSVIPNPDTFTTSFIELYRPSNDAYGFVDLNADNGITGMVGRFATDTSPICFDDDGFLWFLTIPWATASTRSAASTLYKCTVDEAAGVLSLTVVASYTVPDDPGTYPSTLGYQRMVYDVANSQLYFWSSFVQAGVPDDAGFFFKFTPSSEDFTTPVVWSGRVDPTLAQKFDSIGFNCSTKFATALRNGGAATNEINIFDIASETETQVAILDNFGSSISNTNLSQLTFYVSMDGLNTILYAIDKDFTTIEGGWSVYRDALFSIIEEEPEPENGFVGGSGAQMEPVGIAFELYPFALGQAAMNSCIELGPFRFAEQKQADETALISSLILGISQQAIGIVVEEDWNEIEDDTFDEDWNEEVDQDGDDIYEDWSEGSGDSDDFTLTLRATDDGISKQFQGDETLEWIEDFGSSKQYTPVGYSAIYHRLHICARNVDEYWAVKTIDIAGVLTGRHL